MPLCLPFRHDMERQRYGFLSIRGLSGCCSPAGGATPNSDHPRTLPHGHFFPHCHLPKSCSLQQQTSPTKPLQLTQSGHRSRGAHLNPPSPTRLCNAGSGWGMADQDGFQKVHAAPHSVAPAPQHIHSAPLCSHVREILSGHPGDSLAVAAPLDVSVLRHVGPFARHYRVWEPPPSGQQAQGGRGKTRPMGRSSRCRPSPPQPPKPPSATVRAPPSRPIIAFWT